MASDLIRALALARIKHAVARFADYAASRKVWLTLETWTVAGGLMTPALKLKRQAIESAFAKQIAEQWLSSEAGAELQAIQSVRAML